LSQFDGNGFPIQQIRDRLYKKNKNYLAVICGATGDGKSYSALQLCKRVDPSFNIERVAFRAQDFLDLLDSNTLKKGNAVMWDEVGAGGLPAKTWWAITNRTINYVLQTFRTDNLCVIMTTQDLYYIDKDARKLLHSYMEALKVDDKEESVLLKYLVVQNNPLFGKIYYKYPRVFVNGHLTQIYRLRITKPPEDLIREYERRRAPFVKKLKRDAKMAMKDAENKNRGQEEEFKDIVDKVLKKKDVFVKDWRGRKVVDASLVAAVYDVGGRIAEKVKKAVELQLNERISYTQLS